MRAADTETADFPDDPAALRALLAAALSRCDALEAERDGIAAERDALARVGQLDEPLRAAVVDVDEERPAAALRLDPRLQLDRRDAMQRARQLHLRAL